MRKLLDAQVSFGHNIRQPDQLQTRRTSDVLDGIASGEWKPEVDCVRNLPFKSDKQRQAKQKLPFVTWSGEFAYRRDDRLIRHSGQMGVDVDGDRPP